MRSIGGWKTISTRVKLIAVVAVLLMVFSSAVCIVGSAEDGSATVQNTKDTAYQTTVVYEPGTPTTPSSDYNDTTAPSRSVVYSGNVISTEYNPQVWDYGSETGGSYWYKIKSYSQKNTVVFIGWQYQTGVDSEGAKTWTTATYDPGDVLVYENGTWYADYTTSKTALYLTDGKIHVKAAWGTVNAFSSSITDFSNSGGSKYTNFYLPTGDVSSFSGASNCTVRPGISDSSTGSMYNVTITMPYASFNDVVLDNLGLNIRDTKQSNNHADSGDGIYANGDTLIFGDGIECKFGGNLTGSSSYYIGNVYGGSSSKTVDSTKLIFHSGIYSNIVGGGGTSKSVGKTYVVINGATVTDTLIGAGNRYSDTTGDAWVFATGLKMYGDYYTESEMDNNFEIKDSDGYYLRPYESSIFTGGSNNQSVKNTHVYLSGDSAVWDLQAGGRRGNSTVTEIAEVDVSGNAMVRHALCGSITDGSDNYYLSCTDSQSVKTVKLHVRGDAKVASVFGAGYDTSYYANYSSMYGEGTSITIDVSGGTVGYIYGGGYRGTIGYQYASNTANPIDSITINISGGEILYDVFGGGRGGVDKVCHDEDGRKQWSEAYKDFTGKSEVYADSITINMTGGIVKGNIYGGGESVPWLDGYTTGDTTKFRTNVASVHISDKGEGVTVKVSGGTVGKSVYGGGKGIDADDTSVKYVPKILAFTSKGVYTDVNWLYQESYEDDYTLRTAAAKEKYATYALVYGNIAVNIRGTEIKTTAVGENVYGGGAIGLVGASGNDYSLTVNIQKYSSVAGSVYGAGKGTSTSDSLGQVYGHTSVTVGGTVLGNIYGGGAYGQLTGSTEVTVTGTVGTEGGSYGNVFGAGQGSTAGVSDAVGQVGSVVKVLIDGSGLVYGNVYGGGAYGNISKGDTTVTVNSNATVKGSVYGGGQGASGGETWVIVDSSKDPIQITQTDSSGNVNDYYVTKTKTSYSYSYTSGKLDSNVKVYTSVSITDSIPSGKFSFVMEYNGAYVEGKDVTFSSIDSFEKVLQRLSSGIKAGGETVRYDYDRTTITQTYVLTSRCGKADVSVNYYSSYYSSRDDATAAWNSAVAKFNTSYTDVTVSSLSTNVTAKFVKSTDGKFIQFVMKYSTVSDGWWSTYRDIIVTCTSDYYVSSTSIDTIVSAFNTAITKNETDATIVANYIYNNPSPGTVAKSGEISEIASAIAPSSGGSYGYVPGSATVAIDGNVEKNVYGGGAFGAIGKSTTVSVSGTVGTSGSHADGNVYGGGQGLATSDSLGKVGVNSEVTITGIALGNVYGGGAYGIVDGSTTVTVSGKVGTEGSDYGNVYGGGQGVASGSDSKIGQVTTVTEVSIKSGAIIYNSVYGGGAHGNVTSSDKTIPVTIESGAIVYKNVFGGGYGDSTKYTADDGYVAGSTVVSVAGTVKGNVYGGGGYGVVEGATSVSVTGTVDGTVYGGGFGFAGEKSNQGATVAIDGKVGRNVYGGARNGKSEGNTSVTITSATVGGTVYGGGLGSVGVTSVTGTSSVTATSSNISGSVYGAAENGIVGTEGATVDQTSSVVLDSTKVGENVFGGGVGELGKVSVYGKTSVEVKGTTEIGGSVYGAAKNGYVTSSQVTITSGTVKGDVYGAGLGAVSGGNIQVSVTGNVTVTMSGGTVEGLLYGGAAYGQV